MVCSPQYGQIRLQKIPFSFSYNAKRRSWDGGCYLESDVTTLRNLLLPVNPHAIRQLPWPKIIGFTQIIGVQLPIYTWQGVNTWSALPSAECILASPSMWRWVSDDVDPSARLVGWLLEEFR